MNPALGAVDRVFTSIDMAEFVGTAVLAKWALPRVFPGSRTYCSIVGALATAFAVAYAVLLFVDVEPARWSQTMRGVGAAAIPIVWAGAVLNGVWQWRRFQHDVGRGAAALDDRTDDDK